MHHPELYVVEQLGCARLALLLEIRRWLKLAQLKPGYLLVVCLQFVIGDETVIQCRHPGHHCLLRLVLCPIQFHQICGRSGTHRCSHRSDELSLFVVRVRYGADGAPKNAGPRPFSPPRPTQRPGAGCLFRHSLPLSPLRPPPHAYPRRVPVKNRW